MQYGWREPPFAKVTGTRKLVFSGAVWEYGFCYFAAFPEGGELAAMDLGKTK